MKPLFVYLFSLILSSTLASTYEIPPALAQLYTNLTRSAASCDSFLDGRKNLNDGHGNKGFGFCTEIPGALYLRGPRGQLGDMDVDCDGSSDCGGKSNDYQSGTAFDDELSSDRYGITSLDAELHPYVVLGTCDVDVSKYIQPLSVVAVICGGALHYGVFGDTNGCDDDNFTGEASLALAKLCFPDDGMSGNNGHTDHDVLYLAFRSSAAVPGSTGANWTARNSTEFEASLKSIGDQMVEETVKRAAEVGNGAATRVAAGWAGLQLALGVVLAGVWVL